jgi:hypothetical protein
VKREKENATPTRGEGRIGEWWERRHPRRRAAAPDTPRVGAAASASPGQPLPTTTTLAKSLRTKRVLHDGLKPVAMIVNE